ncbi:MAG: uroporphyrinogen-III synthase [Bacteroidales bacterium]|nr:uroporphyrinogen-III synthase [Bacteroidales bacterium]
MALATSVKRILISQPKPEDLAKSQYKILIDKYKVELTFEKFFDVVGVSTREFRDMRIALLDYSAVIMTSKLAVDNYFRLAKELRITVPESMKYFCISDTIANYLQNYVQYRKRKIFYGKGTFLDLVDVITKHKEETYLFPCAEDSSADYFKTLETSKITFKKAVMYRSEVKDLSAINIKDFDMVAMFSPIGVKAFVENFQGANHENIFIAAFGTTTQAALKSAKLRSYIPAPTPEHPSMVMAIDKFLSLTEEERAEWMKEIDAQSKRRVKKTESEKASGKKKTATTKKATTKTATKASSKTTATKKTTTRKTTTTKKTAETAETTK